MSDSSPISRFARQLLQQDKPLSDSEYKEYRMKLQTALATAKRRERLAGIVALVSFVVGLGLMFVGGSKAFGSFDPWSKNATVVSIALGVIYVLALVAFPVALASYFSRFRPKVQDIKDQIRDAQILALQGEVAALRQEIAELPRHNDS